jgi:hypothetical protein
MALCILEIVILILIDEKGSGDVGRGYKRKWNLGEHVSGLRDTSTELYICGYQNGRSFPLESQKAEPTHNNR